MKQIVQGVLILSMAALTGCVAIFMPSKQPITISTGNRESVVYVNNEEVGQGKTIQTKIKKAGVQQVVVQTPDFKDAFYVLNPQSRPIAFWPMILLDIPFFYPLVIDPSLDKGYNYAKYSVFKCQDQYVPRTEQQRYIRLDAVKFDIKNLDKDYQTYFIAWSDDLPAAITKAEKERVAEMKKEEAKAQKKKKGATLDSDDNKVKSDDSEYSENIFKSLKKMGFVDTLNKVFSDANNTLVLEGIITNAGFFYITYKGYTYKKAKLVINWRFKNTYGELLDSLEIDEFSGDFSYGTKHTKIFADAVDKSYFNLISQPIFLNYLKTNSDFSIKDESLSIPKVTKGVKEVADALSACVIIKQKDGSHGSGFAISHNGYIITNYHVIAGKSLKEPGEIQVILPDGTEIPVKVVRFNRNHDIALLKVDQEFPYAFTIPADKQYKVHQEVYAAGAPKSIELGQTVSLGLISNDRKINNKSLLQLSISVNPGNSGGPLFDKSGQLHGVVTSKLVGYATEGVGFAIPAYLITEYLNLTIN